MIRRLVFVLCFLAGENEAAGHDPFELTTTARISGAQLTFITIMTRSTALALLEPARAPGTAFSPEDLPRLATRLETAAAQMFELSQAGPPLAARSAHAALTPENELELTLIYPAPAAGPLRLVAKHVERLGPGYASALTITQDEPASVLGTAVFTSDAAESLVHVLSPRDSQSQSPTENARSDARLGFARTFVLGVQHIFGGFDHLLFLAGLLLACHRPRVMLAVVTAFSLAHSLTLALATFELVTLPPRPTEAVIAASIVLVGIGNLLHAPRPRLAVALCFSLGLVHGFGFAGALRELGVGHAGVPVAPALLGFNLGVEAGQLLLVVPLLPLLLQLRKSPNVSRWLLPSASLGVASIGLYWLIERTLLS